MIGDYSLTDHMSLEQLSAQLAANDVVAGVVWMGTTGTDRLIQHSDYDILLFMQQLPVPLHVVFTTVDGLLTDVIFSDLAIIDRILASDDLSGLAMGENNVLFWLANGRIIHDADGRIQQAQSYLQTKSWTTAAAPRDVYQTKQKTNYNWLQTRRMLAAGEDVYDTAVDMRLLYMLSELTTGYFIVRGLRWGGEKSAVRYWQAHAPQFLTIFKQCLAETGRHQKFVLYEQLARMTLAPVGGLWAEPVTSVSLVGEWGMDDVDTAVAFWHDLVS